MLHFILQDLEGKYHAAKSEYRAEYILQKLNVLKENNKILDWFECDELMCPIIVTLLNKGYITTYCCSGHYVPSMIDILENEESNLDIEIDDNFNGIDPGTYIGFESNGHNIFPQFYTLPDGWEIDKYKTSFSESDHVCIRYRKPLMDKFMIAANYNAPMPYQYWYAFNEELIKAHRELLKWAINLPNLGTSVRRED